MQGRFSQYLKPQSQQPERMTLDMLTEEEAAIIRAFRMVAGQRAQGPHGAGQAGQALG